MELWARILNVRGALKCKGMKIRILINGDVRKARWTAGAKCNCLRVCIRGGSSARFGVTPRYIVARRQVPRKRGGIRLWSIAGKPERNSNLLSKCVGVGFGGVVSVGDGLCLA